MLNTSLPLYNIPLNHSIAAEVLSELFSKIKFNKSVLKSSRRQPNERPLLNSARKRDPLLPRLIIAAFDILEFLHQSDCCVARFCEGELF